MRLLVTGGAGYIGSHTVVDLLGQGNDVTVVDNLSNSSRAALKRVTQITGKQARFIKFDLRDTQKLAAVFTNNNFDAVLHFAGLKAVGESVDEPMLYYQNNLESTLSLCAVMDTNNVKKLIFSSSATVYGNPTKLPLKETSRVGVGITNPYGQTKFMIEQILRDVSIADPSWQITLLRYFNPIGAHSSGLIGEDPSGPPNNLFPYVTQVAMGKLDKVRVFGNDYNTPDGTGIRDYIHVVDLARGHVAALDHLTNGTHVYNLGTGKGVSVLEIIRTFENATGQKIPYEIVARRPGDIASCYADCSRARTQLGWRATRSLAEACVDAWRWQTQNPDGYS